MPRVKSLSLVRIASRVSGVGSLWLEVLPQCRREKDGLGRRWDEECGMKRVTGHLEGGERERVGGLQLGGG
jgi:hypothetical protein